MDQDVETTLRAVTDGKHLAKVKLPRDIMIGKKDAALIAAWARPFSGVCLDDDPTNIHVGDIKPSNANRTLEDLPENLRKRIQKLVTAAEDYGFGMRLTRDGQSESHRLEIVRRVIDPKQLTIPASSMMNFLQALGVVHHDHIGEECVTDIRMFSETLERRKSECMDSGVGHYHSYALKIVEFGIKNGSEEILWGRERRGSIAA